MPHLTCRKAYLVTSINAEGCHGPVYAILTSDPSEAVDAVAASLGIEADRLSFAGVLSRRMAHHLGLKPNEVRLI